MTGTSIDGLDAALVRVVGSGLDLQATLVRGASRPLGALARRLRAAADQKRLAADEFRRLAHALAATHVQTIRQLFTEHARRIDLIAVHGQTLFHEPGMSFQLLDPWPIAAAFGRPVVFDLRGADTAGGGSGAPITPLADHLLFRDRVEKRAIVNLGGFINVTVLPPSRGGRADRASLRSIRAGDVCPCNHLLDAIARRRFGRPYDAGGRRAMKGAIHEPALAALFAILDASARRGRSLGTGDEATAWISRFNAPGADLARTACVAIARTVAGSIGRVDRVLVGGGGVHNAALTHELARAIHAPVEPTDAHGTPAAYREAVAMAVLGALAQDRVPLTLVQATGVQRPMNAGAWIIP